MVFAAQHVRDAHARIIYRIGKEERGRPVGAANDEVADVVAQEALFAMHEIRELDALARWHAKARRRRGALRAFASQLLSDSSRHVPA